MVKDQHNHKEGDDIQPQVFKTADEAWRCLDIIMTL